MRIGVCNSLARSYRGPEPPSDSDADACECGSKLLG